MTLRRLTNYLEKNIDAVQVVCPSRKDRSAKNVSGIEYIPVAGFSIPKYPELRFGMPVVNKLKRLWRTNPPSIIHIATEGPLGWAAQYAAKL